MDNIATEKIYPKLNSELRSNQSELEQLYLNILIQNNIDTIVAEIDEDGNFSYDGIKPDVLGGKVDYDSDSVEIQGRTFKFINVRNEDVPKDIRDKMKNVDKLENSPQIEEILKKQKELIHKRDGYYVRVTGSGNIEGYVRNIKFKNSNVWIETIKTYKHEEDESTVIFHIIKTNKFDYYDDSNY